MLFDIVGIGKRSRKAETFAAFPLIQPEEIFKLAELVAENNITGFIEYLEQNRTKIHNSIVGDSYLTEKLNQVLMNALDKFIK